MVAGLQLRQGGQAAQQAPVRAQGRAVKVSVTRKLTEAYNSRDETITHGFDLGEDHFDVHRFHPPLVYGRRGDCEVGEGICLLRGKDNDGEPVFLIICYELPIVSARAIPQGIEFFNTYSKRNKSARSIRSQSKF